MQLKAFPLLELKSQDNGRFSGYAATYQRDEYGDRFLSGAFAPSIREQKGKIPLYWDHMREALIGFSTDLAEDAKGLYIEGALSLDSTHGRDAYANLKLAEAVGFHMGLSVGFTPKEESMDPATGDRLIKSVRLFETSLTTMPVNKFSRVEQLKSARYFEEVLEHAGCSGPEAKRAFAALRPYLSVGTDGQQPHNDAPYADWLRAAIKE